MNFRLAPVLLASSLACTAAEQPPSIMRFANASMDQLSGSFASLSAEHIVWNSPILEKPTSFWLKNVLEVTLPASQPEFNATHEATLTLMNGDCVRGQIAAVTDDTVTLDTWYAGRLNFRRVMVKDVVIDPRPALVFSGPTSLDGWTQTAKQPAWTYENGSLRTSSNVGIGRDVGLPDECSIGVDLSWRGTLMLNINFFADDVSSDSPALGYQVSCQGSFATIRRQNAGMQFGDPANIPEFQNNEKARLELRASRRTGNICLFVNGRCGAVWKDPGAAKGKFGKSIQFLPRGKEPLRLSVIKVSAWDGILEENAQDDVAMMGMGMNGGRFQRGVPKPKPEPEPAAKPKSATDGRMKLRNGDSIGGEVTSIVDGMISIKTPFADVKLPVARVRNIILKPAALEEPIRRNGDVRAWFADGSSLVICLDSMTPEALTGHSQLFGSATFKLAAFNRIEFNIYDPQITDLRAKEELISR